MATGQGTQSISEPGVSDSADNASKPTTDGHTNDNDRRRVIASSRPQTPSRYLSIGRRRPAHIPSSLMNNDNRQHTYERLEDLLREAGYKETRIFTPESNSKRAAGRNDIIQNSGVNDKDNVMGSPDSGSTSKDSSASSGTVSTVMGFITGLVAGSGRQGGKPAGTVDPVDVTSKEATVSSVLLQGSPQFTDTSTPSPTTRKRALPPTPSSSSGSLPRLVAQQSSSSGKDPQHRSSQSKLSHLYPHPHPHHQHQLHLHSHHHQHRSKAQTYLLRHMASAPNVAHSALHPNNHPYAQHSQDTIRSFSAHQQRHGLNEADPYLSAPPLPPTWLQTVARAVLYGGEGAYIGGPPLQQAHLPSNVVTNASSLSLNSTRHPPHRNSSRDLGPISRTNSPSPSPHRYNRHLHPQNSVRRDARNHGSSALFSDSTNASRRGSSHSTTRVEFVQGKFRLVGQNKSTGNAQVSCTKVVCRSAPASRASSRVRDLRRSPVSGKASRQGSSAVHRGQTNEWGLEEMDLDMWLTRGDAGANERQSRSALRRQLSTAHSSKGKNVGALPLPSLARTQTEDDTWNKMHQTKGKYYLAGNAVVDSEDDDDDDDDEEGELDLAKMLVPPKRQNSIRSLRRHLDHSMSRVQQPARTNRRGTLDPEDDCAEEDRSRIEDDDAVESWTSARNRWTGSLGRRKGQSIIG